MTASVIIAGITFLLITLAIIFFPAIRIHRIEIGTYWIIALVGAAILLFARLVPVRTVWEALTSDTAVNPLKILVLFFSMTFLSIFLDEVGLFRFLARKAVAVANTNQLSLFMILYFLAAILTVFTSNDIVILTLTPFICFFCKNARISPIPYLVAEFAAANTYSMMLIIGNPTNIYLATSAGIGFLDYLKVMALPTLCAGAIQFGLIVLLFFKQLRTKIEPRFHDARIESKPDLIIGVIHLAVCLIALVISGYINVPMWLISAGCALSLLVCVVLTRLIKREGWKYLAHSLVRLPWQLIPFVISMFVIVICLNYRGVSAKIGELLGSNNCVWTYGASSYLVSNVINNIPMSILFSTLPVHLEGSAYFQAVYASVVGSNVGAFLTPIGALAGIMFTGLTRHYDVKYGFKQFIGYGALLSVPTLGAALGVLALIL